MKDEIVDEIHEYRKELAEHFDFDVRKLLEHLREEQQKSGRKVVSRNKNANSQPSADRVKKVA